MIITNIRYPPMILIRQIRDELVIRENISPELFKEMMDTRKIPEYRDLILEKTEVDIKEGVNWRYEELQPGDLDRQGVIIEYHLAGLTLEITDKIRIIEWNGCRYEILEVFKQIHEPDITLVIGQSGAIRRYILQMVEDGVWINEQNLAERLEMVRDKRGQLMLDKKPDYIFDKGIRFRDNITIFDGIVDRLRSAYSSPALSDVELYKKRIITEENERNIRRLQEIGEKAGDNEEYRDALQSRLRMQKNQFVDGLKLKLRQLNQDREKLNDHNRYRIMGKYHGSDSFIDQDIQDGIKKEIMDLQLLSRLSGKPVYILYDMSRALYFNGGMKFNYSQVGGADRMIDEFRSELNIIKEVYVTDDLKDRYRLWVDGVELDISSNFR